MIRTLPAWARRASLIAHRKRITDVAAAIEYLRTAESSSPLADQCRAMADPIRDSLQRISAAGPKAISVQDALVTLEQASGIVCAVFNSGPLGSQEFLFQAAYLIGYAASTMEHGAATAKKGAAGLHSEEQQCKQEFLAWWSARKGQMTKPAAADEAVKRWPLRRSTFVRWLSTE